MAATIAAVIVNAMQSFGGKSKRRKITPMDFIPRWGLAVDKEEAEEDEATETLKPKPAETIEEMKKLFQDLARSSKSRMSRRPPASARKTASVKKK